jgi:concanavalin A-like lectin/glucanase superfamily protein/Big-like domain-containing protein/fibronectin type III domain protein
MTVRAMIIAAAIAVSGLFTASASAAPNGLVAAYSFDENAGATLGDQSGNGLNGTIVGANWAPGKYGAALSFNGSSARVDLPPLGTFYKTGFTLEAWVNKSGTKKDVAIVGTWDWPQSGPMLWVDHISGRHYVTASAGLENYLDSGQSPATGTWQHLTATYDGATLRYYIDGVQVASRAFTGNVGDFNTWRIGAYGGTPFGFFDGSIDDVRIYDRALSTAEVQGDMTTPVAQDTTPPTAPTDFVKTGAGATTIATSWTAATDNVGVAGYRVFRGSTQVDTTSSTSYTFTGLACNQSYTLGVEAYDGSDNTGPRTMLNATAGACDTTAPSVSITAPGDGSTVSGTVNVTASASDDTSVAGVQFKLDGADLGGEDTGSPYSVSWNTGTATPGTHTLTAVARDPSGNTKTSTPVTVTVNAPPAGSGPVAAYSFDDGAGTVAGDASGNGRQGTIVGPTWTTGKNGSALSFDGSNDRVDLPDLGVFYKAGFTLEAWVNKSGAKKDVGIVGSWDWSDKGGPMLWIDDLVGRYRSTLGNVESDFIDSGQSPSAGTWQHIAATFDGSTARFYVDGTQVASKAFSGNVGDTDTWRIGAYGNNPFGFFDGKIDDVRIYNRALSAGQVGADMSTPVADAPAVVSTTPSNNATGLSAAPTVRAKFNMAMNAATVNTTTVQVKNGANVVPATVGFDAATSTATLNVTTALTYGATYTATVKGGSSGVKSAGGGAMTTDRTWSFTVVPKPPILVITSSARPFSNYAAEILEAEGLAESTKLDLSLVTPPVLSGFDTVVLGDAALTTGQVSTLTNWVNGGGNLIALRPDKKLASLLGLFDIGSTLSNAYIKVNTAAGNPGAGIAADTMQFHGTADRYVLNGATAVATLYSSASTATVSPAVTVRSVGSAGGQAAAFTYDLGRSVVYTRQGNPAWAGQDRDGIFPTRPNDLFFGAKAGDLQPDWVDMNKVAIPQADEQQRLLANLVTLMGADRKPVPRFWYFPHSNKAAVVMTGDDHAQGGTAGRFDQYLAASPAGCSVADWECVRSTSYLYNGSPLTAAQAQSYTAQGFEVASHLVVPALQFLGCKEWTAATLPGLFDSELSEFRAEYPGIPSPTTERMHCVTWNDWATQPKVELANGIRLDTNYYYYPDTWMATKPGFMTGSGMPMRFADTDGSLIDVYQATTQITDESGQPQPSTINALLDNAVGANGYYGAFVANIHTDNATESDSDAIVASAQARDVPIVSAKQLLDWTDGREASTMDTFTWSNNTLGFKVKEDAKATGLTGMVPMKAGTRTLSTITLNGNVNVPFTTRTIKGISYAMFDAATGTYAARYL